MNHSVNPQAKDHSIKCSVCNQEYEDACPTKSSECPFAENTDEVLMDKDVVLDVPDDLALDDEFMDEEEEDDLLLDPLEEYE